MVSHLFNVGVTCLGCLAIVAEAGLCRIQAHLSSSVSTFAIAPPFSSTLEEYGLSTIVLPSTLGGVPTTLKTATTESLVIQSSTAIETFLETTLATVSPTSTSDRLAPTENTDFTETSTTSSSTSVETVSEDFTSTESSASTTDGLPPTDTTDVTNSLPTETPSASEESTPSESTPATTSSEDTGTTTTTTTPNTSTSPATVEYLQNAGFDDQPPTGNQWNFGNSVVSIDGAFYHDGPQSLKIQTTSQVAVGNFVQYLDGTEIRPDIDYSLSTWFYTQGGGLTVACQAAWVSCIYGDGGSAGYTRQNIAVFSVGTWIQVATTCRFTQSQIDLGDLGVIIGYQAGFNGNYCWFDTVEFGPVV